MAVVDTLTVAETAKNKAAALKFMASSASKRARLAFNKEKRLHPAPHGCRRLDLPRLPAEGR